MTKNKVCTFAAEFKNYYVQQRRFRKKNIVKIWLQTRKTVTYNP